MALGMGEGSETNMPLARAVIGGLLVSTFMTLLFVPVLHALARRRSAAQLAEMGPRPWPQRHKGSHGM
jgi:Cu/Ag efflux pump CusA